MNRLEKINKNIPIMFQELEEVDIEDTRFTKVKIWLMHLGQNYNGSSFEKEVVTEAIPTLANTPILCYIEENNNNEKDCSDHRYITTVENGEIKRKYAGQAVGVIPETNNASFEIRLCDDGIEREFLTCEGLIWNKWEDIQEIMNRDKKKSESMELHENFDGYFDENDIFHFSKFSFFGACVLGKDVEPAMISASVELKNFSLENVNQIIQNKFEQYKSYCKQKKESEDNDNMPKQQKNTEPKKVKGDFSLSIGQQKNIIYKELEKNKIVKKDYWGDSYETTKFHFTDMLPDENKVVLIDSDYENYYGVPYSFSGDMINLDYDNKKLYMRGDWREVKDGTVENEFTIKKVLDSEFETVKNKIDKKENEIKDLKANYGELKASVDTKEKEFNNMKQNYEKIKQRNVELEKYQTAEEEKKREAQEKEVFEKYEKLEGIQEFEKLKQSASNFENIKELDKECALLYFNNFNVKEDINEENNDEDNKEKKITTKFSVDNTQDEDDGYGGLLKKYIK